MKKWKKKSRIFLPEYQVICSLSHGLHMLCTYGVSFCFFIMLFLLPLCYAFHLLSSWSYGEKNGYIFCWLCESAFPPPSPVARQEGRKGMGCCGHYCFLQEGRSSFYIVTLGSLPLMMPLILQHRTQVDALPNLRP